MKIKADFVSNSSSTSFVYISEGDLTKADFFEAAGVREDSPVGGLFSQMFQELSDRIREGDTLVSPDQVDQISSDHEFTPETLGQMKFAIESGRKVIVSKLSSENNLAEAVLCTEIFEIESDKFLINAYSNYW